jgi:biopolymer transport protein ExbD
MSAGGMGGGGGKRNVNVELNLVPFIDLLSTLICFLLITAVWQQIQVISTNTSATTSSDNPSPADDKKVDLSVSLLLDHIEASEGPNSTKIPYVNGEPDYQTLLKILDGWKAKYPDRNDVTLHSDSQAMYKYLIKLMDTAAEAHFEDVGINTN